MYFVKYGKEYLHDPRVDKCQLLDLSLTCEENSCGYCDFTIYSDHPMYDKLQERDAENPIEVYDDDALLFTGYIYELGKEFYLDGHVKCKGELDYLNESIVRPYSTEQRGYGNTAPSSINGYFEWLIEQHNNQVDYNRRFVVGINQGNYLGTLNTLYASNDSYPTTINEISDVLLSDYGGYLRVRHEDGVRYIDYLAEWTDKNTQILDFGVNLTDYSQIDDSEGVATFVVPVGATMSSTAYDYKDGYSATADISPASKADSIPIDSTYRYISQNGNVFRTVKEWRTTYAIPRTDNIVGKGDGWNAAYIKIAGVSLQASYISIKMRITMGGAGVSTFRWALTTSTTNAYKYMNKNISEVTDDPYQLASGTFTPSIDPETTGVHSLGMEATIPADTDVYVFLWGTSNNYGNFHMRDTVEVSWFGTSSSGSSAKTYYTMSYSYEECYGLTEFLPDIVYYEYVSDDEYTPTSDTTVISSKTYYIRHKQYTSCADITEFESGTTYYEYDELEDESNMPLTLTAMSNGRKYEDGYLKEKDYIYNIDAFRKYGWIGFTYANSELTTREDLALYGYIALKEYLSPKRTVEIKAVDMHLIDKSLKTIRIGEYVRVRSKPHNFDSYLLCRSIELDLNNPENSIYTLGTTFDTLTGQQNKRINELNGTINKKYDSAKAISESAKRNSVIAHETSAKAMTAAEVATDMVIPIASAYESGELNGVVLKIDSSRGIVFKNNSISTVLSVVIYKGSDRITNITELYLSFGDDAYLQWYKSNSNGTYTAISSSDPMVGSDGFTLTITAGDVDTKATFMCELIL